MNDIEIQKTKTKNSDVEQIELNENTGREVDQEQEINKNLAKLESKLYNFINQEQKRDLPFNPNKRLHIICLNVFVFINFILVLALGISNNMNIKKLQTSNQILQNENEILRNTINLINSTLSGQINNQIEEALDSLIQNQNEILINKSNIISSTLSDQIDNQMETLNLMMQNQNEILINNSNRNSSTLSDQIDNQIEALNQTIENQNEILINKTNIINSTLSDHIDNQIEALNQTIQNQNAIFINKISIINSTLSDQLNQMNGSSSIKTIYSKVKDPSNVNFNEVLAPASTTWTTINSLTQTFFIGKNATFTCIFYGHLALEGDNNKLLMLTFVIDNESPLQLQAPFYMWHIRDFSGITAGYIPVFFTQLFLLGPGQHTISVQYLSFGGRNFYLNEPNTQIMIEQQQ